MTAARLLRNLPSCYRSKIELLFATLYKLQRSIPAVVLGCLPPVVSSSSSILLGSPFFLQDEGRILIVSRFSGVFLLIMYVQLLIFQVRPPADMKSSTSRRLLTCPST